MWEEVTSKIDHVTLGFALEAWRAVGHHTGMTEADAACLWITAQGDSTDAVEQCKLTPNEFVGGAAMVVTGGWPSCTPAQVDDLMTACTT